MNLREYLEKNSKELQTLIKECLDESPKGNNFLCNSIVGSEILRIYNQYNNVDFQAVLVKDLETNPTMQELLNKELLKQDEDSLEATFKDNEEAKQESLDKSFDELAKEDDDLNGEKLDDKQKEEIKENVSEKEKEGEKISRIDIKAELKKAIYMSIYEKYDKLKQRAYYGKNGMVENNQSYAGDKVEYELYLYRNYLQKLDMSYRGLTGKTIVQDDSNVEEILEDKELKNIKTEKNIGNRQSEKIEKINILIEKLEDISNEMTFMALNSKIYKPDDYKDKMDELQERYVKYSNELDSLNPSYTEIYDDINNRQQADNYYDKRMGKNYIKDHYDKLGVSKKLYSQDVKEDQNLEQLNTSNIDTSQTINASVDNILEALDKTNDIVVIKEYYDTLKSYMDSGYIRNEHKKDNSEDIEVDKNTEKNIYENEEKDIKDKKDYDENILISNLKDECRKQAKLVKAKYKKVEEISIKSRKERNLT